MARIGLFPLNIVLFPGSAYPLRIFEKRYLALIQQSIDADREFGILLLHEQKMAQTGCLAKVAKVTRIFPDGMMEIVVLGTDRFVIEPSDPASHDTESQLYLTANWAPFEDIDPRPDYELLETSIALYNKLVESVYGEAEEILDPSEWLGGGCSFRMAQKCGLDLTIRQQLLEMRSENERLTFIHTYLAEILPKIRQVEKMQMLVRNDGYFRPDAMDDWS